MSISNDNAMNDKDLIVSSEETEGADNASKIRSHTISQLNHLPASTVRLISSAQVITSPLSVVKELTENSLDAFATSIDVKLENGGLDLIKVRDNGCGIHTSDTTRMAQRHFTSKISDTDDLQQLQTYGFRGEALGSLCAVADVTITTKTTSDEISMTYETNRKGEVIGTKPSHLGQGTTVTACNLFAQMPVRRLFCEIPARRREESKQLRHLLAAFALIRPDVRFSLAIDGGSTWTRPAVPDHRSALLAVWGSKVLAEMLHRVDELPELQLRVEMFLPKPTSSSALTSRTNMDLFFIFVNRRPVVLRDLEKVLRQHYCQCISCDSNRYPIAFISVTLPPSEMDFNVDPNKTRILLHNRPKFLAFMTQIFKDIYGAVQKVSANENGKHDHDNQSDGDDSSSKRSTAERSTPSASMPSVLSGDTKDSSNTSEMVTGSSFHTNALLNTNMGDQQESTLSCSNSDHIVVHEANHVDRVRCDEVKVTTSGSGKQDVNCVNPPATNRMGNCTASSVQSNATANGMNQSADGSEIDFNLLDDSFDQDLIDGLIDSDGQVGFHSNTVAVAESDGAERRLTDDGISAAAWSKGTALNGNALPVTILHAPSISDQPGSTPTRNRSVVSMPSSSNTKRCILSSGQSTISDMFDGNRMKKPASSHIHEEATGKENSPAISELCKSLSAEERKHCIQKVKEEEQRSEITSKRRKLNNTSGCNKKELSPTSDSSRQRKRPSVHVQFSMQRLKKTFSSLLPSSQAWLEKAKCLHLIGPLRSHAVWLCHRDNCVLLAHPIRIQEQLVYRKLMSTYSVPSKPLEQPIVLSSESLGDEKAWSVLQSVLTATMRQPGMDCGLYYDDCRLVMNGFHLRQRVDDCSGEITVAIVSMAVCVNFIGVTDLCEILTRIASAPEISVAESRPMKIKHFLQSEAVRMSRQLPLTSSRDEMRQLLDSVERQLPVATTTCFHNKPFLLQLYDFDEVPVSQSNTITQVSPSVICY